MEAETRPEGPANSVLTHETVAREGVPSGKIYLTKNALWDTRTDPYISVTTPVYNRREELRRAMASVARQTFRDFEYIVVNDGSTEELDDVVEAFMEKADFPMLYIRKPNGGVHTARNLGIAYSRGILWGGLDSDDEYVPEALQVFYDAWMSIPDERKPECLEVVARCQDENGDSETAPFPDHINDLPIEEAREALLNTKRDKSLGDNVALGVLRILRENPWPEPEGITFVSEGILQTKLGKQYRSWCMNECLYVIHHIKGEASLSRPRRTIQNVRNWVWNLSVFLNRRRDFGLSWKEYLKDILIYDYLSHVLFIRGDPYAGTAKLEGALNRVLSALFWLPMALYARIYVRTKLERP